MKEKFPGYLLSSQIPARQRVADFTEQLAGYIFPVVDDSRSYQRLQDSLSGSLQKQLLDMLAPLAHQRQLDAVAVTAAFFEQLPAIKDTLVQDAAFILEFDPAAYSLEEVIVSYPGFNAIVVHRLANALYQLGIPVLPRMMSEWAHSKSGIDINPGASIACPFFIDHGTGVVIGETATIGCCVKIYQGVTLGALSVRKEDAQHKRHPTIGDNVVIYAGSTILGGDTVIGHDSIIGGNTWVTESVPAFSVVYHKNQTVVSDRRDFKEPLNFII